jgi:hypothetical protein
LPRLWEVLGDEGVDELVRRLIGSLALIGTVVSVLLAIGQFVR